MLLAEQQITQFISTNLTESFPDFDEDEAVDVGSVRRDGNWYFKAITNISPLQLRPMENKAQWFKYRPSQRYAMLDMASLTFSTNENITPINSPIIVTYEHQRYDVLAFGGVIASKILIEFSQDDFVNIHWDKELENETYISPESEANWYDYYYGEFSSSDDRYDYLVRTPSLGGKMRVTIYPSTGIASCGYMISGKSIDCGKTLDVVNRGIIDNSLMDTDEFGTTNLVFRDSQREMVVNTNIKNNRSTYLEKKSRQLRGKAILIIGDESDGVFENLLMLGFLTDSDIPATSNEDTQTSWSMTEKIY